MKKTIYLAGGCFWGVEKYLSLIPGVLDTEAGYANGKTENPTAVNRQGNDAGVQYRTGIYYTDPKEKETICKLLEDLQTRYEKPVAVENAILENYYPAEAYHQNYLDRNPGGCCHIPGSAFKMAQRPVADPPVLFL